MIYDSNGRPVSTRYRVTFAAEVVAGGEASWWISDTVSREREVLFADGFENGGRARWQ